MRVYLINGSEDLFSKDWMRPDKIVTLDRIRIKRTLGRIYDSKLIQSKLNLKNIL